MNLYLVKVIDARNLSQAEFDKSEARLADYLMTLNDSNEKSARGMGLPTSSFQFFYYAASVKQFQDAEKCIIVWL